MRKSIGPCERLAVTLQYLASGTSYKRLQNKYRISKKTLAKLIKETCGSGNYMESASTYRNGSPEQRIMEKNLRDLKTTRISHIAWER